MIFVTVGTHEQQFDRLIKCVDELKKNRLIDDDIIMQTGYCSYTPKFCEWKKIYPYNEMQNLVKDARIVITHGGPSSFLMPLQNGKIPIVVPRQKRYEEHINDHQLSFAREVANRMKNIILIENIDELLDAILNYELNKKNVQCCINANNDNFNTNIEKIAKELLNKRSSK